jgi:hypothetical protein
MAHLRNASSSKQSSNVWQGFTDIELPPFESISKTQMSKALIYFDMLINVDRALENVEPEARQAWQNATEFNREDEFLNRIAKKINISDLQLDFIFEIGATL